MESSTKSTEDVTTLATTEETELSPVKKQTTDDESTIAVDADAEEEVIEELEPAADKSKKEEASDPHGFNVIQRWAFPVHKSELPKVIPVVLLLAIALFIYTGYRDVKDPIVFGEEGQSLITIQYCKVIVMLTAIPAATIFLKLDNMVSRDFIFFQTALTFGMYFLLNGVCLYPYRDALHQFGTEAVRGVRLNEDEDNCKRIVPLLGTFVFPVNTLSFVFSELWGTISVSFLVWGYVNLVTPKDAAKRYYAVLGLGGQLGSMLGALFVNFLSHDSKGKEQFIANMRTVNIVMAVMCGLFAGVYAFLQYYIMKKPEFIVKKSGGKKKAKPKMSVMEAFKYCLGNGYVLALCGMVFAYGFSMVLGEMTYKDLMKLHFSDDQAQYSAFKALESSLCSCVAIFLMIFVGHNVIRLFGWLPTALMTPIVCGVITFVMYVMALSGNYYEVIDGKYFKSDEHAAYLETLVNIGLTFAVLSKSMKYSSFDPAKELAYLVLTSEQKYKAKAAVDIIGARFGKGGGALFNIVVINLALGEDVSYVTRCLWASFAGVMFGVALWCFSDTYIAWNKDKVGKQNEEDEREKVPPPEEIVVEGDSGTEGTTKKATVPMLQSHNLHIEMSTAPDASYTVGGDYPTPATSRTNTPELR